MAKVMRPKRSILHEAIPQHLRQFMHLTRLAELGRVTANIAHEVNNPLSAIQGLAENIEHMLTEGAGSGSGGELDLDSILKQVLEIQKCVHRASKVIKNMSTQARQSTADMSVIDLAELALNASEYLKNQMNDIKVEFDFHFDKPVPVQCEAGQVEQIVINILSNAIHALQSAKNGGPRKITISFDSTEEYQMMKVWNNGPAIPKEIQNNLTLPFFTTKPEGEGTGLGLNISKSIMQAHGGDLSFSSEDSSGTEFVLIFPKLENAPWQKTLEQTGGQIVIIDRQPHFGKTLGEKFKSEGFNTLLAANVEEAIALSISHVKISGILIDIVPGTKETLTSLNQLRRTFGAEVPIFTVSSYPSARDNPSQLKRSGATDCYQKPLRAEQFNMILGAIHRTNRSAA